MLAFAIIGGLGLIILLTSLVVGELLDAFDVADLGISSIALGAGLTGFGAVGVIATANGLGTWAAIGIAIVLALVTGVLTQGLIDNLIATDTASAAYDATGLLGTLTADTNTTSGEVRLEGPDEIEARLAWSTEPLTAGTRVRVVAQNGSRVQVEAA